MSESNGADEWQPLVIAACSFTIIVTLVLGVGVGSHLVLRHVVQTLPLWIVFALGAGRSSAAGWAGLTLFCFWLLLMALIWLYLLGISNVLSGNFTPREITMTIIVGLLSIVGILVFFRMSSALSAWSRAAIFVVLAVVQIACFRLSFMPGIAQR